MEAVITRLRNVSDSGLDHTWSQISDTLRSAGLDALGTSRKRHRDWFDESNQEVKELLRTKNAAHNAAIAHPNSTYLRRKFAEVRAETQRRLREIENKWWLSFAQELQSYADTN